MGISLFGAAQLGRCVSEEKLVFRSHSHSGGMVADPPEVVNRQMGPIPPAGAFHFLGFPS
jgi:hypothetical protein